MANTHFIEERSTNDLSALETTTIKFEACLNITKHPQTSKLTISRIAFESMCIDFMTQMRQKFITEANLELVETTWNENGSTTAESDSSSESSNENEEEENVNSDANERLLNSLHHSENEDI